MRAQDKFVPMSCCPVGVKKGQIFNPDCNISPDELDCLVLVGVVPAVAELDQLLVGELEVPHGAGHSFHLMRQLSLLARGFNVRSYTRCVP